VAIPFKTGGKNLPFENLEPEIREFIDKYIDSFVTWDVLNYFHENPEVECNLSIISSEIGRHPPKVEPSLSILTEMGVLFEESGEEGDVQYKYVASAEFRAKMEKLVTLTNDRTNRLAIVSLILQKESRRL